MLSSPKKISQLIEKEFKGNLLLDLNKLHTFIVEKINPTKFSISNESERMKSYCIKVAMVIDEKVFEIYLKPPF